MPERPGNLLPTPGAPNLFLLGAAKAGTTSLHAALARHPDIAWASGKETGFFCDDQQYHLGLDYYLDTYFSGAPERPIRGEATPSYLCSPTVPQRVHELLAANRPRFIVVFRDPVERAYSQYWMMVRHGLEHASFEEAIATEPVRRDEDPFGTYGLCYAFGSRYADHVARWFELFPDRDDYLFLLFDDLCDDPTGVLRRVTAFLGVPHGPGLEIGHENAAAMGRLRIMQRIHATPPWMRKGAGRLLSPKAKTGLWQLVDRLDRRPFAPPPLDLDLVECLRSSFAPDVSAVEELVRRPLPAWRGDDGGPANA